MTRPRDEVAQAALRSPEWRRACAGCGAIYGSFEWHTLPLSGTLASETVQIHLSVPVPWRIEQRACRCGNVLSGLVRAA